jgi:hypothetical protein
MRQPVAPRHFSATHLPGRQTLWRGLCDYSAQMHHPSIREASGEGDARTPLPRTSAHRAGPDGPARTRSVIHHDAPLNGAVLGARPVWVLSPMKPAVIASLLNPGPVRARWRSRPLPSDDVQPHGSGHTPGLGHLCRHGSFNQPSGSTGRLRGIAACSRVHVIPACCRTSLTTPKGQGKRPRLAATLCL